MTENDDIENQFPEYCSVCKLSMLEIYEGNQDLVQEMYESKQEMVMAETYPYYKREEVRPGEWDNVKHIWATSFVCLRENPMRKIENKSVEEYGKFYGPNLDGHAGEEE